MVVRVLSTLDLVPDQEPSYVNIPISACDPARAVPCARRYASARLGACAAASSSGSPDRSCAHQARCCCDRGIDRAARSADQRGVRRCAAAAPDRALALHAAQAQLQLIGLQQRNLATLLARAPFGATEIYRVQRVLNAIAVRIDGAQLDAIRKLPGVKDVQPLALEYPTSNSIRFIGAPQLWNDSLGLGQNLTGSGVKIGIIDTGIDYEHANFGGTGLLADYQANDRTTNGDGFFPTAKVVGGTDFAGDAYNGSNSPAPTLTQWIAMGTARMWPGQQPVSVSNRIPQPILARMARAHRLARCGSPWRGASRAAICAARLWLRRRHQPYRSGDRRPLIPNGDSDFSDHLDVINMSLGSNFGDPASSTDRRRERGQSRVIVVASAGNSGDTYFITGSPATRPHHQRRGGRRRWHSWRAAAGQRPGCDCRRLRGCGGKFRQRRACAIRSDC